MVYITGDTHGDWFNRFNATSFPEGQELSKNDYVVICGDFGLWHDTAEEKVSLEWLNDQPWTTLFVDGNHENFDRLNDYPISLWHGGKTHMIHDSIIHLMRGQVFTICDKTFFTFGGATSHDVSDGIIDPDICNWKLERQKWIEDGKTLFRVKGISWWPEELPNSEEMREGWVNLYKNNFRVDYMITHSPDASLALDVYDIQVKTDTLTQYLSKIKDEINYKQWFFGHLHMNKNFYNAKATCLFEQIIRLL